MRAQVVLGLLQQWDQPLPLIVLDGHEFQSQRQARLDLHQDQHFPPIQEIFFRHWFFLPFDFHFTPLFDLAAPLVTCWGGHFASIQRDQQIPREEPLTRQQLHHLIEQSLHLFLGQFADGVRQTLGGDRSLFLCRGAAGISTFGQPVFTLMGVEADQLHQRQIAKQDTRQFIHGLSTQQHFQKIQQHKLHGGDQGPFDSRQTHLFKRFQHPLVFEKDPKFIEQPCIALDDASLQSSLLHTMLALLW